MAGFGIEGFSNDLQSAIVSSPSSQLLPNSIYHSVSKWIGESIWPFVIGIAITVTLLFAFYGGFLYFTAYGDENRATQAKKSITYAIIGFVITLLAFSLTGYIQDILVSRDAQQEISAPAQNSGSSGRTAP